MTDGFAEGYAVGQGNSNNMANSGWGFGMEWIWIIILFAFWGNGAWGNNGNNGGNGYMGGYDIGRLATTNDVASGFSTSAIMSDLNDLQLGQAGIQQTLCQGFSGVNQSIMQNGYETRDAINNLGYRLQDCCCQTQRAIDGVNYNMAKNTCDITNAINNSTREVIGFMTNEKISSLQAENAALTAQLSQNAQTRTLLDALQPVSKPAYITCSPYQAANYGNFFNNGCGCGCNG